MSRVKFVVVFCLAVLLSVVLFGCASTKPPTVEYTKVVYTMPRLTPAEGSQQEQAKGKVRISCTAVPFVAERYFNVSCKKLPVLIVVGDQYPVEVKRTPFYQVEPDHLIFKVKVHNNLDHVLRLEGTVVSFRVGHESVPVERSGYDDFLAGMLPPREEMEF